jgi:hypothetical protein
MLKIIGISGKKQSGKNTAANYISGDVLRSQGMISDYILNDKGSLQIKTLDHNGNVGWGEFDLLRKDSEFCSYAENAIWPHVKIYHFADYLKKICVDLFDLTPDQVYGTDIDKNSATNYNMKAIEVLHYFGTDVMRKIKDSIWVDYTIKKIKEEESSVALIPDVRFPNEVAKIKEAGGVVIRLDRNVFDSDHHCETSLDENKYDWSNFDYIIKNNDGNVSDLCKDLEQLKPLWR